MISSGHRACGRRAAEPSGRLARAAVAAAQPRRPLHLGDRRPIRIAQRLALGLGPAEVAQTEGAAPAEIEALLAQDGFAELVAAWQELLDEPTPAFLARLEKLCRIALHNALTGADLGAALFCRRELARGRDPVATLLDGVRARARRAPRSPPAPPASPAATPPRRNCDPLDALVRRRTAVLREAVVAEHARLTVVQAPVAAPLAPERTSAPRAHGTADRRPAAQPRQTRGP